MSPEDVKAHFTRSDGSYQFARWGRPIAPVIFGVQKETWEVLKGAIEAVTVLANHKMTDLDPELGANLMIFFVRNWQELSDTPKLEKMIPELDELVARLHRADANQYRLFRFDSDGAIQACFVFLRMDDDLANVPAETLALSQMAHTILLWSDQAFLSSSPLARISQSGAPILRPEIGELIRAAYDPFLPSATGDPSHAFRLFARMDIEK